MSWLRRNRWWLVTLVPALLLALAASSFRLTQLYLPWEWSRPVVAGASVGTLEQAFLGHDANRYRRTVTVEVAAVEPVPSFDGHAAIPGATLWQVDLLLTAAPDQMLKHCSIELVDGEGTRYGFEGGRRAADPDDPFYSSTVVHPFCVPDDAPGPELQPITGEFLESPVERPGSWELSTALVVPDGHDPEQVRIAWDKPSYLVLEVP